MDFAGTLLAIKLFVLSVIAAVNTYGVEAQANVVFAASNALSKNISIIVSQPETEFLPIQRVVLRIPSSEETETVTTVKPQAEKKSRNPFQKQQSSPTPKPSLSVKPIAKPSATPRPSPPAAPTSPTPSPRIEEGASPTPTPIPTPEISIGTILIGNNPLSVKAGQPITFTVFVRDDADGIVQNRTLPFMVNGKTLFATTDASGNTLLEVRPEPSFVGSFPVIMQLGNKTASFVTNVFDTRPDLASSYCRVTRDEFFVRLKNGLQEAVANWPVTMLLRDGTIYGSKITSELGTAEFERPPLEPGAILYACADIKDVGKCCDEWGR